MNEKSYTELMKIGAMKRQRKENFVQDLYIDMLLSEIQLNVEREKLLKKSTVRLTIAINKTFIFYQNN